MATKEVIEQLEKDQTIFKRREYGVWKNLMEICHDSSHPKYKLFGGKGIQVCQLWRERKKSRGYLHFIGDMGFAPDKHFTLRRLNPKEDFKPSNCIWFEVDEFKSSSSNIGIRRITIKENGLFKDFGNKK